MLCYVLANDTIYILQDDLLTWSLFSGGASGGDGWNIVHFTGATQVTAIGVADYPTYQLWMNSTVERYLPNSYQAEYSPEGHINYGFVYQTLLDFPHQVDTNDLEHVAFYSNATQLMTIDFPTPRTGVLTCDWRQ